MKLSHSELARVLEREPEPPPVVVVTGSSDLLRELAAEQCAAHGLDAEPTPFNFERFDGAEAEDERVVAACNLLSMLGGRRVVVVKRASKLVDKSEALAAYLKRPSERTTLVLDLEKTPDRRRKAWKDIEKSTMVVVCDAPAPAELERWIVAESEKRGLRLGREEARYLAVEVGSDLRRLLNEIEKLALYAEGATLDEGAISAILGRGKAQNIFKFVDAIGAADRARALVQLGRLLEEGEAPLRILALIDRLVGQLRIAREVQSGAGGRGAELARALGVPPYAAKSLGAAARRFDESALAKAVAAVAGADRTLKSSRAEARVVLESLTLLLCEPGGRDVRRERATRPGG